MWCMPSSCIAIDDREEPNLAVDPTGQDLKHFLADDPGGPVVMLNLLRFKERGRKSYEEYAHKIVPFLEKLRAQGLFVGALSTVLVAPDTRQWDAILIIRSPSRQAFSSMVADPNYQEITH